MTAPPPAAGRRPKRGARGSRIRADIRTADGEGFTRYFSSWPQIAAWIAGEAFTKESSGITSIRIVHQAAQSGGAR